MAKHWARNIVSSTTESLGGKRSSHKPPLLLGNWSEGFAPYDRTLMVGGISWFGETTCSLCANY